MAMAQACPAHAVILPTKDCCQVKIQRQTKGNLAMHNDARETKKMVMEFYEEDGTR